MHTKKLFFIIILCISIIAVMIIPNRYLTVIERFVGKDNNSPRAADWIVKNQVTENIKDSTEYPVDRTYDPGEASQKRLERAAIECAKHNIVYNDTSTTRLVSNKYKVIINVMAKVGSGTWRRFMREIDPTCEGGENKRRLNSLTSSEFDQYVRGVFFREPLERLVSFYHFVISPYSMSSTQYFSHYYEYMRKGHVNATMNNKPYLTFSQLAQMIIDHGQKPAQSWHWQRQYIMSRICEFNYTFVGHMNHLADDAPYFVQLAFDDSFHYPEVHGTRGKSKFNETMSTLSQKIIDQLIDHYRLDYEILGFNIPVFPKK